MDSQTNSSHNYKHYLMLSRYRATMLLAAVGDAIGFRQGVWEFNRSGPMIHNDMMRITDQKGISQLDINPAEFRYSDDTVMHIATAQGLLQSSPLDTLDSICTRVAKHYKSCMRDMSGRAPGMTCIRGTNKLKENGSNWMSLGFEKSGGGCGASMRAACIGLYFYNDIDKLTKVSIETGRITHHNPLGYLGSFVSALFTSFAIQDKPPNQWLSMLLQVYLPKAKQYVKGGRDAEENLGKDWDKFQQCWLKYAERRRMLVDAPSEPFFPEKFGVEEREDDYHYFAINGWPGALGVDSVIIAYDALLSMLDRHKRKQKEGEVNKWEQVCLRGMLHGGDSDSTGTIVAAWYGALYGFEDVYEKNIASSQNRQFVEKLGFDIYQQVYQQKQAKGQQQK